MPDTLHFDALIATARIELDRAHRAARTMEAGEIRRGLQLAIGALQEARATPNGAVPSQADMTSVSDSLETALADLDNGSLSALANLLEGARKQLGC